MNRDDIHRMAREAFACHFVPLPIPESRIEHFARLVAAAEREACAQVCEGFDKYAANAIRARGEK